MQKPRILIIEDEAAIAETLVFALEQEGFTTIHLSLGQPALSCLEANAIDLIILDVGLPDISGFELCKRVRQLHKTPIIFLTARSDEIDRIVGLEIGGDDYVTKPFSPREVAARVKVILRRVNQASSNSIESQPVSHFLIDEDKARITFFNQVLDLTRYEYLLLCTLLSEPERVFSREQLLERVWGHCASSLDRAVDGHIKSLRAKLRLVDPVAVIVTHRGLGYSANRL